MTSMREVHAVLVAGGKASRMGQLAEARPKALLPFGRTSLLSVHLQALRTHGVRKVTVIAGRLSDVIGTELQAFTPSGMAVDLIVEPFPAGSGGCLRYLPPVKGPILVVFADIMAWMDYTALVEHHRVKAAQVTVVVHPNDHPADSDLVETTPEGWLRAVRRRPRPVFALFRNLAVAGIFVLEPETLLQIPRTGSHDFVHDLLTPSVESGGRVLAYRTSEYLRDCGTPERYSRVLDDFQSGRVHAQYRTTLRPALFIDRDGTLNRHIGYINKPDQVELLPGVAGAIRRLNQSGTLAIVITNQPVVARGECSIAELDRIHARLELLLGNEGAFLDAIYACPHHPDGGFEGEVPELKMPCNCRKPEPGLVHRAARELPVDVGRCAVVGDSERDVELAKRLGLSAYRISSHLKSQSGITAVLDLSEAVSRWLGSCSSGQASFGG